MALPRCRPASPGPGPIHARGGRGRRPRPCSGAPADAPQGVLDALTILGRVAPEDDLLGPIRMACEALVPEVADPGAEVVPMSRRPLPGDLEGFERDLGRMEQAILAADAAVPMLVFRKRFDAGTCAPGPGPLRGAPDRQPRHRRRAPGPGGDAGDADGHRGDPGGPGAPRGPEPGVVALAPGHRLPADGPRGPRQGARLPHRAG